MLDDSSVWQNDMVLDAASHLPFDQGRRQFLCHCYNDTLSIISAGLEIATLELVSLPGFFCRVPLIDC